jgi:hypothetical protein
LKYWFGLPVHQLERIGFAVFLVRGERDPTKGHGWGMQCTDASATSTE